ncbi:hypothetical protein PG997_013320 [Apiospora hydei]|uniref:DUF6546 domain-containing protein n=1 Tax=Apiospora hydei TaxID=1337664 RepID=A0ABR1V9D1_9PEZI
MLEHQPPKMGWSALPSELRAMVMGRVTRHARIGSLASVCREWQVAFAYAISKLFSILHTWDASAVTQGIAHGIELDLKITFPSDPDDLTGRVRSPRSRSRPIPEGPAASRPKSQTLKALVAVGLFDAHDFLNYCRPGSAVAPGAWGRLEVLWLTSGFLVPGDENIRRLEAVLKAAAKASSGMLSLQAMQILTARDMNRQVGSFAYAQSRCGTATVTWKATWQYSLGECVREAWMECADYKRVTLGSKEDTRSILKGKID